ncbi:MAG TPA: PAN domain-containing protein [Xanthobacteraceae bacterium]|jgi:hypothetical protein
MRMLALLLIAVLFAPAAANAQTGFDRPGGDYSNFSVRSGDPVQCAARCERDGKCHAWSFSYPRRGSLAMCWLKSEVTARTQDSCCVSGVKGAAVMEPRDKRLEYSIDRLGGDYRAFESTPDPTGKPCADACQADNRCRAWTYVRAGYQGAAARCYLKNEVKPPRRRPCCISAVVR